MSRWSLIVDDMRDELARLPEASVDSCVTDPPYELGFMGKAWDSSGIAFDVDTWRAVYRVLKPGAYLLAFGGTRTVHRIACAIEDAGFEIRDQLSWLYGTGFPKSLDVSKAIDKVRDDRADVLRVTRVVAAARDAAGKTNADIDAFFGRNGMSGHWTSTASQPAVPSVEEWGKLRALLLFGDEMDDEVARLNARKGEFGEAFNTAETIEHLAPLTSGLPNAAMRTRVAERRAPNSDEDRRWEGWGTALKPACEPVVVARKPLDGTVAHNVTTYGTGAINVDACRIPGEPSKVSAIRQQENRVYGRGLRPAGPVEYETPDAGRWPANVLLDEDAARLLDENAGDDVSRFFYITKPDRRQRDAGLDEFPESTGGEATDRAEGSAGLDNPRAGAGRRGGSRNIHATVKPIDLFRYLTRLVTPPGGVVLDPFAGSGTMGIAALLEGFRAHLVELDTAHACIAHGRLVEWESYDVAPGAPAKPRKSDDPRQPSLL